MPEADAFDESESHFMHDFELDSTPEEHRSDSGVWTASQGIQYFETYDPALSSEDTTDVQQPAASSSTLHRKLDEGPNPASQPDTQSQPQQQPEPQPGVGSVVIIAGPAANGTTTPANISSVPISPTTPGLVRTAAMACTEPTWCMLYAQAVSSNADVTCQAAACILVCVFGV